MAPVIHRAASRFGPDLLQDCSHRAGCDSGTEAQWTLFSASSALLPAARVRQLAEPYGVAGLLHGGWQPHVPERVLAHALKIHVLTHRTGSRQQDLSFHRLDTGRPVLARGPEFSLSHSGDRVLVLVGPTRPGVDVQRHRQVSMMQAVADSAWPAALSEPDLQGEHDFFQRWTLAEALGKSLGCGLVDLRQIAHKALLSPCSDGRWVLRLGDLVAFNVSSWPGYSTAVCGTTTSTIGDAGLFLRACVRTVFWTPGQV